MKEMCFMRRNGGKMEENRLEEYQKSLEEAEAYPEDLSKSSLRLKKRIHRKRRRVLIAGVTSLCLLFILIVNTPTAMAEAILKIPVIGTLAEYVCFDKGLQNAIKNEYAQEVDLVERSNGYTLGIPYVIADSKRLVLFYQPSDNVIAEGEENKGCVLIQITKIENLATGKEFNEYTSEEPNYTGYTRKQNEGLVYANIRTVDLSLPRDLRLYITLKKEIFPAYIPGKESRAGDTFEPASESEFVDLGTFVFELHLGDYPAPKVIRLNRDAVVEGQTLHINTVTLYPTGTEVSITLPESNSFVINGLRIKAIDNNGGEWGNPGGIISSGPDENGRILYYLEGDYFHSKALSKLRIDGIRMFNKSEKRITIDLLKQTMTPEASGIRIKQIERAGEKAYITFETDTTDCFGIFEHAYQDTEGNDYYFNSESYSDNGNIVENYLTVVWPENNKVIMSRSMSSMLELKNPVEIDLTD